jgi:possible LPS biosynthesis protein
MEDVECKIMPIPYFDRLGTGELGEMHYEGEKFQKLYPILDYKSFDFAAERPDCIVIHSPYDEKNQVFSVDPFFYSKNMKKFTNKLVYIPSFVTDEIDPKNEEDGKAFGNMDFYVTVPGVFHADLTIVQSEEMRKAYLAKISIFTDSSVRKQMSKKISGAGSCLFGDKEDGGSKSVVSAFRRFLMKKEDGNS